MKKWPSIEEVLWKSATVASKVASEVLIFVVKFLVGALFVLAILWAAQSGLMR
jgi:hypothetical protein